jgi:hypothetical protein
MAEWKRTTRSFVASVVSLVVLAGVPAVTTHAGQTASADAAGIGELQIQGEQIKLLVLRDDKGREKVLPEPGSRVTLPVGEYHLERVILQGDHSCRLDLSPVQSRLTVDPNAPAVLRVGAPLRQVIEVRRRGSVMVLAYEMVGQGGERYSINRDRNSRSPSFAVYRGDRKVASGDFEFG